MRNFLSTLLLFAISTLTYAQLSSSGIPRSFNLTTLKTSDKTNSLQLKKLDLSNEVQYDIDNKIDNRYAVYQTVNINLLEKATITNIKTGKIYTYKLSSKSGYSIGVIFSHYNLPVGSDLYIYNPDKTIVYGAFTSKNNNDNGVLAIADFPGNELIIEYFEPHITYSQTELVIGKIGQSYREVEGVNLKSTNDGLIDVKCPEGDKHRLEKNAVAKMSWEDDGSGYICSGALINNAKSDGTPYFLTANHCISTNSAALSLITHFKFEGRSCGSTSLIPKTLSGSKVLVTSATSDVTLLKLDETPTADYSPYYAGFDAAEDKSFKYGVGIHHPSGRRKKISIDYDTIISYGSKISWEGNIQTLPNTHWLVYFDKGYTEGGSSGSPLFNGSKKIVGQLHGGGDDNDFYGKLSSSWSYLQKYLDPKDTTGGILNGYIPTGISPEAHFYTEITAPCLDNPIKLIDASAFEPDSWNWTITPTSYAFVNGTSATDQFPEVSFQSDTSYSIELEVTNSNNNDISVREDYIDLTKGLNVEINTNSDTIFCPQEFTFLRLKATGAESYLWIIEDSDTLIKLDTSTLNQDEIYIYLNDSAAFTANSKFTVSLTGYHGTCSQSTERQFSANIPENDNIQGAIELNFGDNGPFNNQCATVQENEPNPKGGDCNSQENWCDCEVSDILLDNSLWFKFIAPESGIVSIDAPGFDNQLALYEAVNAEDIISGNESLYSIIAANDDYFGEADDYSALIQSATVVPGNTYWLQIDGSACGTSGDFYVKLYNKEFTGTSFSKIENKWELKYFPNPVTDNSFTFNNSLDAGNATLKMISLVGQTESEINLGYIELGQNYEFYFPASVTNGVYLIQLRIGDQFSYGKVIVNR